jgi:hypothetical protein
MSKTSRPAQESVLIADPNTKRLFQVDCSKLVLDHLRKLQHALVKGVHFWRRFGGS